MNDSLRLPLTLHREEVNEVVKILRTQPFIQFVDNKTKVRHAA